MMHPMPVDQGEYEALYRTHYARLVRLCRLWLDDPHEAEDVVQEVFLKLLVILRSPHRPAAWDPWLTRVTRNVCHDRRRSGWWKWWRTAPTARGKVAERPQAGRTLEDEALNRERQARIWQAFQALPTRQREVFALRYVEGYSTAAVAEALGLTVGSVKRHLFRAVCRLRDTLGGYA
jgi:RNA polymerase sigma-70 factor (ECF subfamily)